MPPRDGKKRGPCAFTNWKLSIFILLGVEALGSAFRGGLTPLMLKATRNKDIFTEFFIKIKNFGCCEWGENDILHEHLKSASYPDNLLVGGLLTSLYFLFTGVCKCYYYNNGKLHRKKWVNFLGMWLESPFSFSAALAAVEGLPRGSSIFLSTLLLWLFPQCWQHPQYLLII